MTYSERSPVYNNTLSKETKRKCKICGKEFWTSKDWIYKNRKGGTRNWYCSYSCYRKEAS